VMRRYLAIASALLLASVACGVRADGPPEIQVDRTACGHCRMLVSEPQYAAAYRTPGGEALVFDDIQCLLDAAARAPGPLRFWFRDAAGDTWIDAADAVFVRSARLRTPMNGGIVAYRTLAAAEQAATRDGGRVVGSFDDLRASAGDGS
jgi:copper chaperone NosL